MDPKVKLESEPPQVTRTLTGCLQTSSQSWRPPSFRAGSVSERDFLDLHICKAGFLEAGGKFFSLTLPAPPDLFRPNGAFETACLSPGDGFL